mgnify:CR=1 FL=1
MKPPSWLTVALVIFFGAKLHAQQPFQFWATYNHQARLSKKWGYTFDLNYRTRGVFPATSNLSAARAGIIYHLNPKIRITAGYAWFGTFVHDRYQIWLHENRIYEQIQYNTRSRTLQFSQSRRASRRSPSPRPGRRCARRHRSSGRPSSESIRAKLSCALANASVMASDSYTYAAI